MELKDYVVLTPVSAEDVQDLPEPKAAMRCGTCGTRLRAGQPHSAIQPVPHQTYEMLTVVEPL